MDFDKLEPMRFRTMADPNAVAEWFSTAGSEQRLTVLKKHLRALSPQVLTDRWKGVLEQLTEEEIAELISEWGASRQTELASLRA